MIFKFFKIFVFTIILIISPLLIKAVFYYTIGENFIAEVVNWALILNTIYFLINLILYIKYKIKKSENDLIKSKKHCFKSVYIFLYIFYFVIITAIFTSTCCAVINNTVPVIPILK